MRNTNIIGILFILLVTTGCMNELNYSTDPNDRLSFSTDTLSFDTLFCQTPSATRWMKIYNRNKKPLLLESVSISKTTKASFRINIDGVSGEVFDNIEILPGDSLYLLAEVTVANLDPVLPTPQFEDLIIRFNGVEQKVVFTVAGWNAYRFSGLTVMNDSTIKAERPILITDSLVVASTAKLTIEPGSKLYFKKGSFVHIKGRVIAEGTAESPIYFRGDRLDELLTDIPYDRLAGNWWGILIDDTSRDNYFSHTVIRGVENGIYIDSTDYNSLKLKMDNCRIQNAADRCLMSIGGRAVFYGCEFSNGGNSTAMLLGGDYDFIHCTFANYGWWSNKDTKALVLSNIYANGNSLYETNLKNANFDNCIIYGSKETEYDFINVLGTQTSQAMMNYRFESSVIKGKVISQEMFQQIRWNEDPKFAATGQDKYIYDFRLTKESKAIGVGAVLYPSPSPYDFFGTMRPLDIKPDAGAFQFIQK